MSNWGDAFRKLGYGGLLPQAVGQFLQVFGKKAISIPLDHISHVHISHFWKNWIFDIWKPIEKL